MNRRGFMAVLSAFPTVGKATLAEAAKAAVVGQVAAVETGGCAEVASDGPREDPAYKFLSQVYDGFELRAEAGRAVMDGWAPPHIATKRSWSKAYKAARLEQEMRAERRIRPWDMDAEMKLQIARALGFKG